MAKGGSRSRSSTSTKTSTSNLNLQDIAGPAIGEAGGDITIVETDGGAIDAAADIARDAIRSNEAGFQEVGDLTGDVLSTGGAVFDRSTELVERLAQEQADTTRMLIAETQATAAAQRAEVLGAAREANDRVEAISNRAITSADRSADRVSFLAQDLSRDFISESSALVGEVLESTQTSQADFVSSISAIQARESSNNDARIVEVVKFVLIAVTVLGIGGGLAVLRR